MLDPRANLVYVLVPESDDLAVSELLDNECRRAIHTVALRNALGRASDDRAER